MCDVAAVTYLSNHHRESKDPGKIVQQLEDNLKERLGVGQSSDGDEGFHSPVVASNITSKRWKKDLGHYRNGRADLVILVQTPIGIPYRCKKMPPPLKCYVGWLRLCPSLVRTLDSTFILTAKSHPSLCLKKRNRDPVSKKKC